MDGEGFPEAFHNVIVPSAMAIALHDDNVWGRLNNNEKWKLSRGSCPLPSLEFDRDPLSFLLIFCDCAQEWGRPYLERIKKSGSPKKREEDEDSVGIFRLKDILYIPEKELQVILFSPKYQITDSKFIRKQKELEDLQKFLVQPRGLKLTLFLFDKEGKGKKDGFSITGPCTS